MPELVRNAASLYRLFHCFTISALGEIDEIPEGFDFHVYGYAKSEGVLLAQFTIDPELEPLEVRYAPEPFRQDAQQMSAFQADAAEGIGMEEICDPFHRKRALLKLKRLLADQDPGLIEFVLPSTDGDNVLAVIEDSYAELDAAAAAAIEEASEDDDEGDETSFEILGEVLFEDDLDLLWTAERERQDVQRVEVHTYRPYPGVVLLVHFEPEDSSIQVIAYVPDATSVSRTAVFARDLRTWAADRCLLTGPPEAAPAGSPFVRQEPDAAMSVMATALAAYQRGEGYTHDFNREELAPRHDAPADAALTTGWVPDPSSEYYRDPTATLH